MNRKKIIQALLKISENTLYPFWKRRDKSSISYFLYKLVCTVTKKLLHVDAFTVVSHHEYLNVSNNSVKTIIKKDREGCYANNVWSINDKQELWYKPISDICLYEHHDVFVCGDSDVIIDFKRKIGINDLCFNLSGHYKYGDSFTWNIKKGMMLVKRLDYNKARYVKSGIMIAGLYSYNYFHCVLDNLIRLLVLDECNIPEDAVFIIDSDIIKYDSLKRIFKVLTEKHNREIVVINRRELLHVETLYYITHVNEFVIKIENWKLGQYDDYTYDWRYMEILRNRLLSIKKQGVNFGERIFISRKNIPRRQYNEQDLMNKLFELGFSSVRPEELSLDEQIALFNNADIIVGSSGAAMTNLLFCKPGAKVFIIERLKHQGSEYSLIPAKLGASCLHYNTHAQVSGKYDENFSLDVDKLMESLHHFISVD